MKNAIRLQKLFVVILSISVACILFAGLGCKKSDEITTEKVTMEGEGEITEGTEQIEEGVEAPAEVLASDAFGDQVVFVTEGGTGDGTKDSPMGDINAAIAYAKSTWSTPSAVLVAAGIYEVDSSTDKQIKMVEGVSLYGSFSKDWINRDLSQMTSSIKDISVGGGGAADNPRRVVEFESGITGATVIEGFYIEGGSGSGSSSAIFTKNASPTISKNTLNGGSGSIISYGIHNRDNGFPKIVNNKIYGGFQNTSVGVYNYDSSPAIYNNTINGGSGLTESYGVYNKVGSAKIYNNTIDGGNGSKSSYGVFNNGSSPRVYNNTIDGGSGLNYSYGVFNYKGGSPWIYNNIIFTPGSGAGYGIYEFDSTSDTKEVKNNDVFNCPDGLYHDADSGQDFKNVCNGTFTIGCPIILKLLPTPPIASSNISEDPKFVNINDWHLTGSSPPTVTGGGLDLSIEFTTDKDGNTREAPWSMGAYEYE